MAENTGPDIRLSGWLPGVELNGLGLVKGKLWEHFEQAWRDGDTTLEGLRVPVVAVLEVQTVKVPVPGSDDQPTVNVKMLMVEPVMVEEEKKQTVELLTELRARRRGDEPTLFDGVEPARDVADPLSFPDVNAYLVAAVGRDYASGPDDHEFEDARERYFQAVKSASEAELTTERPATGGETTSREPKAKPVATLVGRKPRTRKEAPVPVGFSSSE